MADDMQARLAAARERRERAEAKAAALQADRAATEAVEAEERAADDAETLARAESELGALGVGYGYVRTRLGVIVLRPPNPVLWKRFQDLDKPTEDDVRKLLEAHVSHPDVTGLDRILRALPAVLGLLSTLLARLGGYDEKAVSGKGHRP